MSSLLAVYGGLLMLGPICVVCQRRWPAAEGVPPLAWRARWVDWLFWLVTPLFTGALTLGVSLWIAIGVAVARGVPVCAGAGIDLRCWPLLAFEGVIARAPMLVQVLLVILLVDLLSYVSHRVRHWGPLWRLHRFHHTPVALDWLAAARLHPLDDLLDNTFVMLPVLLLGFDHRLFLAIGPALLLHTLYLHLAVDWRLGRAAGWIVSPAFHRAHHTPALAGGNFGGVLSVWDRLFGSFVEPPREAQRFGIYPSIPTATTGQLSIANSNSPISSGRCSRT